MTSFGGSSDSSQKGEAKLLFFTVSVLNPYIAAAILSIAGPVRGWVTRRALFVTVNQVSAGLMGIPGIIWFCGVDSEALCGLSKRPRLKQASHWLKEQLRD